MKMKEVRVTVFIGKKNILKRSGLVGGSEAENKGN